MAASFSLYE